MSFIEFDTRNKKPKLYNLLALTCLAAVVVVLLVAFDPDGNAGWASVTVSVYSLASAAVLLYSFREQIRYNPYSYNTIFYFGFAVFALSVAVTHTVLAVKIFRFPEKYTGAEIIHSLLASAKNHMILLAPFLLVFSAGLCISNIVLIKHEGKRPVNLLGIILSFVTVGGAVFVFFFDRGMTGGNARVIFRDLTANLSAALYLYFECMLIGTIVADMIAARHEPKKDKDFIIVLGCGLRKDGTPSPILKARLDRALRFYNDQLAETGKEIIFVTSGGKGDDETVSESASMKKYLLEKGVPERLIVEENKSRNTFENMKYSKEKIFAINSAGKVVFATTNYHVFRSGLFARRVKMRAVGMGSGTKWYYWPNAAVREFAGLLTKHRLKQAVITLSLAAVYIGLTVLEYVI